MIFLRKLLLGSLLGLTAFRGAQAVCQCPAATTQELADVATYIFNGTVSEVDVDKWSGVEKVTFDINDTFKGKTSFQMQVIDQQTGTECALDFKEGETYLAYVRWQWGDFETSQCWGTKRIKEATSDASIVGPGDEWKLKLYKTLREQCMGRHDTPCCLNSLKAIREGHFLPEPDQGCADGMIPDRLRCEGSYTWCIPATDENRHK